MTLKQYVVVMRHDNVPCIWTISQWRDYLKNCDSMGHPNNRETGYRIITTFSPNEELKEGGGMKTKEEILRKNIESKCDQTYAVLSAMDEYTAQFAGTDIIEQKDNEIASLKEQVKELREILRDLQKELSGK